MVKLNRNKKAPHKGRTLKRTTPQVLRSNAHLVRNIAIAFIITVLAVVAYIKIQPYTHDARVRTQLESTQQQLENSKTLLLEQQTQKEAEKAKLDEINRQLEETKKQLEAKRNAAVVYAASLPPTNSTCAQWMAEAGIPLTNATQKLILNESGCRTNAKNPSSGACGIPQAWPCSKLPCALDNTGAVCQLKWMDNYVKGRYGTWDNALATWYSRCGSPQGCWY